MVKKGRTILDLIQVSKGTLDWNEQGELIKEGTVIPGSHISDLVYDVVQSSGFEPLGWEVFLDGLAKLNVPERLVTNTNRRRKLQQRKMQGWTPPGQVEGNKETNTSKKTKKKKRPTSKIAVKRLGRLNWEKYP